MNNISNLVLNLSSDDDKIGYASFKELEYFSSNTNEVYNYMNKFIKMFDDNNSYIRTRGLLLYSLNAKWDDDLLVDSNIELYLRHILDLKPITSRQVIKSLANIISCKPNLTCIIKEKLLSADTSIYKDTMRHLIDNDIKDILKLIK